MLSKLFTKRNLILAYIAFLVFAFWYVKKTLNTVSIDVVDKPKKEKIAEVKPADVTLIVDSGFSRVSYRVRLQNMDSISDMLRKLRETQDFDYEKTMYSWGLDIDQVNGIYGSKSAKWVLEDITENLLLTNNIEQTNIVDQHIYKITLKKLN